MVEYIKEKEIIDPILEEPVPLKITERSRGRKPLSDKMKEAIAYDKKELERKKDILISCSVLGELEQYVGEKFTAVQLRKMKKEKLENIFMLYHEKAGFEKANEAITSFVDVTVKGISYVGTIDNEEDFKNELKEDKQLKRIIGVPIISLTEKYGDVVGFFNLFHTIWKHVSFSFKKNDYYEVTSLDDLAKEKDV